MLPSKGFVFSLDMQRNNPHGLDFEGSHTFSLHSTLKQTWKTRFCGTGESRTPIDLRKAASAIVVLEGILCSEAWAPALRWRPDCVDLSSFGLFLGQAPEQ